MGTNLTPYRKGSLADIAGGMNANPHKMAMALRDAELMILVDCSGSMAAADAGDDMDQVRHEAAQDALDVLQEKFPGKIAVAAFNGVAHGLVPSGDLPEPAGSTPLYEAMDELYLQAIAAKMKFVLISDGEPDGGDGPKCILLAEKHQHPCYTIFVGPMNDPHGGREFMKKLAEKSGGDFSHVNLNNIKMLAPIIAGYLTEGTPQEESA